MFVFGMLGGFWGFSKHINSKVDFTTGRLDLNWRGADGGLTRWGSRRLGGNLGTSRDL
jgi:hypothetical protein